MTDDSRVVFILGLRTDGRYFARPVADAFPTIEGATLREVRDAAHRMISVTLGESFRPSFLLGVRESP